MFVWGHIDEVIQAIIRAVSIAMMTDVTEGRFGDHTVHIHPSGFSIRKDGGSGIA